MKRPNLIEMMTFLIKRRDIALREREIHDEQGNIGQRVYNHTIAVDAALLLSWISADEYWIVTARQDASGLKQAVEELDRKMKSPMLSSP